MKTKFLPLFLFLAGAAFADSIEDSVIVFSTKGPDTYADGSRVLDGECYALVWTADGVFEGFSADGRLLDAKDRLLIVSPIAKNGRCPKVMFQIPAASAASYGKYDVFLMDTRVSSASGAVAPRGAAEGGMVLVNGYGRVPADVALSKPSPTVENAVVAKNAAAVPSGTRQPRIKSMRVEGNEVVLDVENVPGFVRVQRGLRPTATDIAGAAVETSGTGDSVTLRAPKMGDSGFYRVILNGK